MNMPYRWLIFIMYFLISNTVYGSSDEVVIIFTGEELGSVEPCGCFDEQIGGISRRGTFIDYFRKQNNIVLPVSLGDLPKSSERQEEIKVDILCRAMGDMGYVVHNLGEKDLEINPQLICYISHTNNIVFLSSNVQIIGSFPIKINQYFIKEWGNSSASFRIAFLGVLSKSLLNTNIQSYVNIYDPVKTLKPLVRQLKDKVNLIVLLSHSPLEESVNIAKQFPEIGLIITGHDIMEPKDSITYVDNTPVVSSGIGGKYIGVVKYAINHKDTERKSVEVIPLDKKYQNSQTMGLLLKEYQQMLIDENLLSKTPQAPLPNGLSYVGSSTCGMCHKIVYDHWYKTKHGTSYNTLVHAGHQYDPECIKCHTTGFGDVSGFINYEGSQNLIDVGCESCHGAGSEHTKNINNVYGLVGESNCVTCHDSEHSPKFRFEEYWAGIKHPKEILKRY